MRDIKWRVLAVVAVLIAVSLSALLVVALQKDLSLPRADLSAESIHIGENVDYVLDYGTIGTMDAAAYEALTARMQPSNGKMPTLGFKYYQHGILWYRFTVPTLPTSEFDWNIRLDDFRVIEARLIVIDGTVPFEEHRWRYDSAEKLAGVGGRIPVFSFERDEIEGKTVLIGLSNLAALRPDAFVETTRLTNAVELREATTTSLLVGGLWAVSFFLLIVGIRARSFILLSASGVILWFGIFGYGGKGYLRAILPPFPHLADAILYGGQPFMMSFILLFVCAYLGLLRTAPLLGYILVAVAVLLPLQGILILLIAFGVPLPLLSDFIGPVLIGMLLGLGTVLWYAVIKRDHRAWLFLGAVLPIVITGALRVYAYLTPANASLLDFVDTYVDIVATMLLLGFLAVFELQGRQERLRDIATLNEQRFRAYAEIASDSYFEVDAGGTVLSAAGRLVRELSLVEGNAFVPSLMANVGPEQRPTIERIAGIEGGPRALRDVELAMLSAAGRRLWVSVSVAPWQAAPGTAPGLRGTISDITDRVERRDREARDTTLAALGQLAGGVAHEVNNLLHPIVNLARRVRDKAGQDADSKKLLDLVVSSAVHAGEIVASILNAFNPTALLGAAKPIGAALADALVAVRSTIPTTVDLADDIDASSPLEVAPGEMLQVVSNLLSNSVRAMDGRGTVRVTLSHSSTGTVLVFADNGPGMSEEMRARATEPFVSGRPNGTGLGLSVVSSIVGKWGGDLDIRSEPGKGTTIVITLPPPSPKRGSP